MFTQTVAPFTVMFPEAGLGDAVTRLAVMTKWYVPLGSKIDLSVTLYQAPSTSQVQRWNLLERLAVNTSWIMSSRG